jgi:hypothetical protein
VKNTNRLLAQIKDIKALNGRTSIYNQSFIDVIEKKCDFIQSRIESIFTFPSTANEVGMVDIKA